MGNDNDKMIEIFSGTLWESEMITSLLKDMEIQSFLKGSVLDSYAFNQAYSNEVNVMINSSDFDKAKEVVDSYLLNVSDIDEH
jgi:hypothetical protein